MNRYKNGKKKINDYNECATLSELDKVMIDIRTCLFIAGGG